MQNGSGEHFAMTPAITEDRFKLDHNPGIETEYTLLTAEILAAIPDSALLWPVVHCIHNAVFDGGDWDTNIRKLTPGYAAIFHAGAITREVNNGGFSQFFFNSSGLYAYDTLDACRRIGSRDITRIMEEVIAIEKRFGSNASRFPEAGNQGRNDLPDHMYSNFEEFDDRFYQSPENLDALSNQYICFHEDEFTGPVLKP